MFKISRKVAIIRASIIGILVAVVSATGIIIANKFNGVEAITPSGAEATVNREGDWIMYDNDTTGTGLYSVELPNGKTVRAFCAQPSYLEPTGGTYEVQQLSASDADYNKIKLAAYIYMAPDNNQVLTDAREEVLGRWSGDSLYAWTHAIIGAIYTNGQDYNGISQTNINNVNDAIDTLSSYIANNSDIWLMAKNYQAYRTITPAGAGIQDVVWIEDNNQSGTINIQKCDSDGPTTGACVPQGGASLADITFAVYNNSGARIYNKFDNKFYNNGAQMASGTTNAAGQVSFANLPSNNISYKVKETATNSSYQLTAAEQTTTLNGNGATKDLRFYNNVNLGSITVTKVNTATGTCNTVGDATLNGTTFQLINNNDNSVNGVAKGEEIERKAIDSNCQATFSNLPYGSYIVKEIIVGAGYSINTAQQTVTIPTGGQTNVSVTFGNSPILGSIKVYINDSITNACSNTGDTSFVGTTFKLYNESANSVNGVAPGGLIATKTVPNSNPCDGVTFPDLPVGRYRIEQSVAGSGYNPESGSHNVTITSSNLDVTDTFVNTPIYGDATVNKQDGNTNSCTTVGNATFNGTTFRIINRSANPVYYNGQAVAVGAEIDRKTLSDGACSVKFENLVYGRYDVEETSAGTGYNTNTTIQHLTMPTSNSIHLSTTYTNTPIYGDVTVSKNDSSTGTCTTVGDATFNNTSFEIINNSTNPIYYGGNSIAKGSVITTKTLTDGNCSVKFENLPYGSYIVKETAVGNGYNINSTQQTVTIPSNGSIHATPSFTNSAILGDVTVNKQDDHTNSCTTVGNATFNGTTFRIINRSTNPVYYNGSAIAVNGVIDSKTLANGACNVKFENLPYGRYDVEETTAGTGYTKNTEVKRVTIPTSGNVHTSTTYVNTPIYGDLTIHEEDAETKECVAVKHLTFVGTTYQVINRSNNPVYYNGTKIPVGAVITTKTFTEDPCNGGLTTDDLPYGTYEVKQTNVPEGYVLNNTPNTVEIPEGGNLHPETTIINQAIRGDVKFIKTDPTNNRPMSDVIFTISRINDNDVLEETHILMTDENGVLNTQASFNLHSYQTNRYDALYEEPDPLQYSGFGTWYGYDNLDRRLPVNDSLAALPYGRYVIQELKCGANLFCYGVINEKATINITTNNQVIDLGDWDNNCAKLSIDTEAVDAEDNDKIIEIKQDKPQAKIKDKIDFCIKPKFKVTIKGILMDKQTGEPLLINGQTVENSVDVMLPEGQECGSTEMTFDIDDITALGGHELVTFQTMWYKDEILMKHHDIDDASETVEVISLTTYAMNKDTGDKFLPYDQQTTVRDIVKYCVKPGLEYTIKGIVMNKETESPLLINGEPVEQEVKFTPENACGELDMFYPIDTTGLAGARLVIFESLYRDNELILEHKDFNNADESFEVEIPAPETGAFTGSEQGSSAVNIALVIFIVSTAGVTVYGVSRVYARKSFLKRK